MTKENIDKLESAFQFKHPILKGIFFLPNNKYKGNKKTTSLNFNTRLVEVKEVEDSENKFQTGNVELEVSNFDSDNDAEINKHPYLLNVIMQAEFRWPNNWAEKK